MTHPNENLTDRGSTATSPYDSTDVPRFGQLGELAKDAFKQELTQFFKYGTDGQEKTVELPNVEKFAIGTEPSSDDLETFVNLIMSYADTPDRFPMVAITSASVREKRMGLGTNFVQSVQYAPSVSGTASGPFNIVDGQTITLTTWPRGVETISSPFEDDTDVSVDSTITFVDAFFTDPTAATLAEVIAAIKNQALYYTPSVNADGTLRLSTGGPRAPETPNYIEITGGDTECLAALGFTVGQSDTYTSTANPPKNRYFVAADLVVNIDVISDDLNTKQELADLVYDYFAYYMEKRNFQLFGRSYFERGLDPEEWFHVIFNGQFSWSGETTVSRPGQEGYDRIYTVRGSVPITVIDYVDKRIVDGPTFGSLITLVEGSAFPDGDFPGENYTGKLRT